MDESLTARGQGLEFEKAADGKTVSVVLNTRYTGKNSNTFDVQMNFIVCANGVMMVNSLIKPSTATFTIGSLFNKSF